MNRVFYSNFKSSMLWILCYLLIALVLIIAYLLWDFPLIGLIISLSFLLVFFVIMLIDATLCIKFTKNEIVYKRNIFSKKKIIEFSQVNKIEILYSRSKSADIVTKSGQSISFEIWNINILKILLSTFSTTIFKVYFGRGVADVPKKHRKVLLDAKVLNKYQRKELLQITKD